MRFLVESGTYQIDNVGDIAMLQRTVWRLRKTFPGAEVAVVTERPERLLRALPGVEPVAAGPWFRLRVVPVPRRWEWRPAARKIRWREKLLAGRFPRLARAGKRRDFWASADERGAADAFYEQVGSADAVVASGGGYVNDNFHEHAWKVFATLNLAQGLGKPTAMFGIGLGPISRHDLLWHGGAVARRLDLMTLREPDHAPLEAAKLGMPAGRIVVTGDDAVAVAAGQPLEENRTGLGVNLRLSIDADVPPGALPAVRDAATAAAARFGGELVPLVIRTADSPANDVEAAERIFGGGVDLSRAREVRTPQQAMAEVARCRVVVTGAYHNAIFALSMGIPVVGLARSAYYASKLGGAARQFGIGMSVLSLEDADLRAKLEAEIARLWQSADELHAPLRRAAAAQIAMSDAAYDRFLSRLPGAA